MNGPHQKVIEIADQTSKSISMAIQVAAISAQKAGDNGRVDAIYAAATGVIGGLQVVASLIGHHGDASRVDITTEDLGKLVNPTSTLLAGILCHLMSPEARYHAAAPGGDGVMMENTINFGPSVMLDAIGQVERLTGRPVDGQINEGMLRSLRKVAESGNEPMNKFLAQRRITPGNIH